MLPAVIDATAVRLLFFTLAAWLHQRDADAITYLLEENRALRAQIGRRPIRVNDDQRRRLVVLDHRLGCARLRSLASLVIPDTLLRWHRQWPGNGPIHGTRADGPACYWKSGDS